MAESKKTSILLVEDNHLAQLAAQMTLEEAGCQVETASTGEKAIELALTTPYTLILMDIGLGETDGFAVTKEIRAKSVINRDTPVIALSAHVPEGFENQVVESGMQGFMTKPLTGDHLSNLFDEFIKKNNG